MPFLRHQRRIVDASQPTSAAAWLVVKNIGFGMPEYYPNAITGGKQAGIMHGCGYLLERGNRMLGSSVAVKQIPLAAIRDPFAGMYLPDEMCDGREWVGSNQSDGGDALPTQLVRLIPAELDEFHIRIIPMGSDSGVTATRWPVDRDRVGAWLLKHGLDIRGLDWRPDSSPAGTTGYVYFIRTVGGPFVKIGWATTPSSRLAQLQTGCPYPLQVALAVAGRESLERKYHRRFSAARVRLDGEWFIWEGAIESYVNGRKGAEE